MNTIHLRFTRRFYAGHAIAGGIALMLALIIPLVLPQLGPLAWLALPVLVGPWLFFVVREMRLAAREMDDKGVTRGDGRRFLWNDFTRLEEVHRILPDGRQGALNHVDLHFTAGRVRLLFEVLDQGREAVAFARRQAAALSGPRQWTD